MACLPFPVLLHKRSGLSVTIAFLKTSSGLSSWEESSRYYPIVCSKDDIYMIKTEWFYLSNTSIRIE